MSGTALPAGPRFVEGPFVRAPRQWRAFLERHPDQDGPPAVLGATATDIALLHAVTRRVNEFRWQREAKDVWSLDLPGDCEDMALVKRAQLAAAGLPIGALRLATGWVGGRAHAVLAVVFRRDAGQPAEAVRLDNRTDAIAALDAPGFVRQASGWAGAVWRAAG